jgi:hypothetical protein
VSRYFGGVLGEFGDLINCPQFIKKRGKGQIFIKIFMGFWFERFGGLIG